MQELTPANGTEVANYASAPSSSMFDIVMDDARDLAEGFRAAVKATPSVAKETLDNTPTFAPKR